MPSQRFVILQPALTKTRCLSWKPEQFKNANNWCLTVPVSVQSEMTAAIAVLALSDELKTMLLGSREFLKN